MGRFMKSKFIGVTAWRDKLLGLDEDGWLWEFHEDVNKWIMFQWQHVRREYRPE